MMKENEASQSITIYRKDFGTLDVVYIPLLHYLYELLKDLPEDRVLSDEELEAYIKHRVEEVGPIKTLEEIRAKRKKED